jgi:hypothetical protein
VKWALAALAVSCFGCASHQRVAAEGGDYPDNPGGDCFWSIKEGGGECIVEVGGTTRTRRSGEPEELYITEGHGKKKWACGEKRHVCGIEVECTCPFPVASDGGSPPDGGP